jgi:phosphate transport system permease protein
MSTLVAAPAGFSKARGARRVKNNAATAVIWLAFGVALVPLVWLLWTVIGKGYHVVFSSSWWTSDQAGISSEVKGGGISAAILGTAEQVALCTAISVPIAVLMGVYLVEYGRGWFAKLATFMVDILTGIPSIVAAVFIYAVFIGTLGGSKSGWLVSLALVLLMVPLIVRTTEEMLRLVPDELREASYALGIPKWRTVLKVVLPTAATGILTGVVLGIARVAGETAPLLVLVLYTPSINADLFSGPQAALPTLINDQVGNFSNSGTYQLGADGKPHLVHNYAVDRLWGAALTLVLIVMVLNLLARFVGRFQRVSR